MGVIQSHDAAAKALGMSSDEPYAAVQGGKSLAGVAKGKEVSVDSVVRAVVADASADLALAVKAGTLTQAQADAMRSSLTARITDQVNGMHAGGGQGRGNRGVGWSWSTAGTSSSPSSRT